MQKPSLAAGGILLFLGGCTIGMDDRPVPPEAIPSVADTSEPATYGAPAQDYSDIQAEPVAAAAPAQAPDAFPPTPKDEMVWQAGPKPVVEASELSPAETDSAEAPAASAEAQAEPDPQAEASAQPESDAAEPAAEAEPSTAIAHEGSFRVAPFVGIDSEGSRPLLTALVAQANTRGIVLDGGGGAMVLKTYLSSYPEGAETVLTYVFDIYAADGTRLTRIDGQEKLPGAAAGWQDAPPELVKAVAKKAMRRLEAWKDGAEA